MWVLTVLDGVFVRGGGGGRNGYRLWLEGGRREGERKTEDWSGEKAGDVVVN